MVNFPTLLRFEHKTSLDSTNQPATDKHFPQYFPIAKNTVYPSWFCLTGPWQELYLFTMILSGLAPCLLALRESLGQDRRSQLIIVPQIRQPFRLLFSSVPHVPFVARHPSGAQMQGLCASFLKLIPGTCKHRISSPQDKPHQEP